MDKLDASEIAKWKASFHSITNNDNDSIGKDDMIDYLKRNGYPVTFANKVTTATTNSTNTTVATTHTIILLPILLILLPYYY